MSDQPGAHEMKPSQNGRRYAWVAFESAVFGATLPWVLLYLLRHGYVLATVTVIVSCIVALTVLLARSRRKA